MPVCKYKPDIENRADGKSRAWSESEVGEFWLGVRSQKNDQQLLFFFLRFRIIFQVQKFVATEVVVGCRRIFLGERVGSWKSLGVGVESGEEN